MNLKNFIYDFNLVTTNTASNIDEFCKIINEDRQVPIKYEGSTSFFDIVNKFNQAYQAYLPNLQILKQLSQIFGEEVRYKYYSKRENFCVLEVIKPHSHIFDEDWVAIYIYQNKEEYQVIATNNRRFGDSKRKRIDITTLVVNQLPTTLIDIIKKHYLILETYKDLQDKFLFGNGTTVILTTIEGKMFDYLDTLTLTFGNSYFDTTDYIEIQFKLGLNLEIMYDESKVTINDEEITDKDTKIKLANELLNELYVNNSKLPELYNNQEKSKVLSKKEQ